MAETNPGRGPGFMDIHQPYYAPDRSAGGGLNDPDDDPARAIQDADYADRMIYRGETLSGELIGTAVTANELFFGLRRMEAMLEDGGIPYGLGERYAPPREMTTMYERRQNLLMTPRQLREAGILDKYDPATGVGTFRKGKEKFRSVVLTTEATEVDVEMGVDRRGAPITRKETKYKYVIGTPEQRKEMAEAYGMAVKELAVRDLIGEHIGIRMNLDFRDNLEGMSQMMHSGRVGKFKMDHLEALFNLPSVGELGEMERSREEHADLAALGVRDPEQQQRFDELAPIAKKEFERAHELGDQIEEAMFLNLLMLKSGSKEQMKYFLEKPGAKFLIAKMAKEKGQTYDQWIAENIGDVNRWEPGNARKLTETWRKERADRRRGNVTQWANIVAWEGNPGEFGNNKEVSYIEETIGGLSGSEEAAWVAATFMRVIGAYASEGYVALPNGKSHLPLGEGRYMSGDDFGKLMAYMFNMKEGLKGRSSGLKDMLGKIPDMEMNLFDWMQVEMEDLPLMRMDGSIVQPGEATDGTEVMQRRSVWDAWLGTAEQPFRSILDNSIMHEITDDGEKRRQLTAGTAKEFEVVDNNGITRKVVVSKWHAEEGYHPLREVNFQSAEREVHGTFSIMQWLEGNERGPVGVFIDAMKMTFRYDEDFALNELKKKRKYHGIVLNPVNLTKGSPHLYGDAFQNYDLVGLNFFRNLMLARINSVSFAEGTLNQKIKLFSPESAGEVYVPAAVLVRAFVKESLAENPRDEEELKKHFIDENKTLRTMGTMETGGHKEDIAALLSEKFEPEEPVRDEYPDQDSYDKAMKKYRRNKAGMHFTGIIRGKNSFN